MRNVSYCNMQISFLEKLRIYTTRLLIVPRVAWITIQWGESVFTTFVVTMSLDYGILKRNKKLCHCHPHVVWHYFSKQCTDIIDAIIPNVCISSTIDAEISYVLALSPGWVEQTESHEWTDRWTYPLSLSWHSTEEIGGIRYRFGGFRTYGLSTFLTDLPRPYLTSIIISVQPGAKI